MPINAATSAGDNANSSLRKKLTANLEIPKIPWTAYTIRIANSSGLGWCPNRILVNIVSGGSIADDSERSVSIVNKCYAISKLYVNSSS